MAASTIRGVFRWASVCGHRPAVMGIVNVTPDSFADGGRYYDPDAAVACSRSRWSFSSAVTSSPARRNRRRSPCWTRS